jgi:hypothetical protein
MRRFLCLIILALALVACSGGAKPVGSPTNPSGGTPPGGAASTNPTSGGTSPATSTPITKPAGSGSGSGEKSVRLPPGTPDHVEGTTKVPVTTEMAFSCVLRGQTQTFTTRSQPDLNVSWAVMWPDNDAHRDYGGYGLGKVSPTGIYTASFAVPANAPLGEARLDVAVAGTKGNESLTGFDHAYWRIAKAC